MGRLTKAESERRRTEKLSQESTSKPTPTPESTPEPASTPVAAYVPTSVSGDGIKTKTRFSITLNDDGRPDVGSMRDGTKEQFRAFIRDPQVKADLGLTAEEPPPQFTEDTIKFFYSALGPAQAYVFALALKCPVELASKVFVYTPEEIAQLAPPTLALANKYAHLLTAYTRWQEEINFTMAFVGVTTAKLAALRKEVAELKMALTREPENPALRNNIRIVESTPAPMTGFIPDMPPPVDGFAVADATGAGI